MFVALPLLGDRHARHRLPALALAVGAGRGVVVAGVYLVVRREVQEGFHRLVQSPRVSAGKVASCTSDVRVEDRVAGDDALVFDQIANVIWCVAGQMEHLDGDIANVELLVCLEQAVECGVQLLGGDVVFLREDILDDANLVPDADRRVGFA